MVVLRSLRSEVIIGRADKRGMAMAMYLMMWSWENMDDDENGVENMTEAGIVHTSGETEDATVRNMNGVTEMIVNEDTMTTETEIGIGTGINDGMTIEIVIVIVIEGILIAIEIATEEDRCTKFCIPALMLQTPC